MPTIYYKGKLYSGNSINLDDINIRELEQTYNLITPTITSAINKGLTVTVNDDKSITVNGTATEDVSVSICHFIPAYDDLILSGSPEDAAKASYYLYFTNSSTGEHIIDLYGDATGEIPAATLNIDCNLRLKVKKGVVCENVTFYPMIRHSFSPSEYIAPYPSNDALARQIIELNTAKIPSGGTTGQVLVKKSNSSYDVQWANLSDLITE